MGRISGDVEKQRRFLVTREPGRDDFRAFLVSLLLFAGAGAGAAVWILLR